MPEDIPVFDHAAGDEYGRGNTVFLRNRKCVSVIVFIAIVERNSHCTRRYVPLLATMDEFTQWHYVEALLQKPYLLFKSLRMNRLEERMIVRRHFVVRQDLKAPGQPSAVCFVDVDPFDALAGDV